MSDPTNVPSGAEADRSSPSMAATVFVAVLASVVLLLGAVLAVDQFFNLSMLAEVQAKVLGAENPALRQLRADEASKLSRWQWVDQKAGVVRIPVERASELVLAEWAARPSGFVPGAAAPVPAPAPAAPVADKAAPASPANPAAPVAPAAPAPKPAETAPAPKK